MCPTQDVPSHVQAEYRLPTEYMSAHPAQRQYMEELSKEHVFWEHVQDPNFTGIASVYSPLSTSKQSRMLRSWTSGVERLSVGEEVEVSCPRCLLSWEM